MIFSYKYLKNPENAT